MILIRSPLKFSIMYVLYLLKGALNLFLENQAALEANLCFSTKLKDLSISDSPARNMEGIIIGLCGNRQVRKASFGDGGIL